MTPHPTTGTTAWQLAAVVMPLSANRSNRSGPWPLLIYPVPSPRPKPAAFFGAGRSGHFLTIAPPLPGVMARRGCPLVAAAVALARLAEAGRTHGVSRLN